MSSLHSNKLVQTSANLMFTQQRSFTFSRKLEVYWATLRLLFSVYSFCLIPPSFGRKGMCTNRVSFRNQCNVTCLSCDFPKNYCGKTHDHDIALTSIRDYIVFPSSTIHCWYFSKDSHKIFVTTQLLCVRSSCTDIGQVNRSVTANHGEIELNCLGASDALSNLSNTVLIFWDEDYPLNRFPSPKQYKNESIDMGVYREIPKKHFSQVK